MQHTDEKPEAEGHTALRVWSSHVLHHQDLVLIRALVLVDDPPAGQPRLRRIAAAVRPGDLANADLTQVSGKTDCMD